MAQNQPYAFILQSGSGSSGGGGTVPPHDQLTGISTGAITGETGTSDGKKYHLTDLGIARLNLLRTNLDTNTTSIATLRTDVDNQANTLPITYTAGTGVTLGTNFSIVKVGLKQLWFSGKLTIANTVGANATILNLTNLPTQPTARTYFYLTPSKFLTTDEPVEFYVSETDKTIKTATDFTVANTPATVLVYYSGFVLITV